MRHVETPFYFQNYTSVEAEILYAGHLCSKKIGLTGLSSNTAFEA